MIGCEYAPSRAGEIGDVHGAFCPNSPVPRKRETGEWYANCGRKRGNCAGVFA